MNRQTEEKIEKKAKQVGLDVFITFIILALTFGFIVGAITQ